MNKQWYKDRIYSYECHIIQLFSELIHTEPKRTVLNKARQMLRSYTVLLQLEAKEIQSLWLWTVNTYNKISKKSWGDRDKVPEAASKQYRAMEKEKNAVADSIEFRFKHNRAMNYINSNTSFYRLSTHANCAEGHKHYQGQIFINEDEANDEEKKYAQTHGILSIRDVMFNEPFLTTRRNCKHFFEPIASELVMENRIPAQTVIPETPLDSPYRAYYDRRKLLIAAGISKKNDSYKRTVSLMKKYRTL